MAEAINLEQTRGGRALRDIYPEQPLQDIQALANRFLGEILHRSSSPVAILMWKPDESDLGLAMDRLLDKLFCMRPTGDETDNARKIRKMGHMAVLWRAEDEGMRYASFRPGLDESAERVGQWSTFVNDVMIQGDLPNLIKVNLDQQHSVFFCGRRITGWDIPALSAHFARLGANPPVFDLKSRNGARNCSTAALDLLESGCITDRSCLLEPICRRSEEGKAIPDAAIAVGSPVILAAEAKFWAGQLVRAGWKQVRHHCITPNYVNRLFKRHAERIRTGVIEVDPRGLNYIDREDSLRHKLGHWCLSGDPVRRPTGDYRSTLPTRAEERWSTYEWRGHGFRTLERVDHTRTYNPAAEDEDLHNAAQSTAYYLDRLTRAIGRRLLSDYPDPS